MARRSSPSFSRASGLSSLLFGLPLGSMVPKPSLVLQGSP
jgi:hypothetical protein